MKMAMHVRDHYRLIAIDLSKQKEFDDDLKAIQQIEFIRQLKNSEDEVFANESIFFIKILEKTKEKRLKLSQRSVTVL